MSQDRQLLVKLENLRTMCGTRIPHVRHETTLWNEIQSDLKDQVPLEINFEARQNWCQWALAQSGTIYQAFPELRTNKGKHTIRQILWMEITPELEQQCKVRLTGRTAELYLSLIVQCSKFLH